MNRKSDKELIEQLMQSGYSKADAQQAAREISETERFLSQASELGGNPEIIQFMENLTRGLPENSYLDQLRFDAKTRTATINGYTADISELTEKMQDVGEARLKSTSRRKNMIYFQMEISLP